MLSMAFLNDAYASAQAGDVEAIRALDADHSAMLLHAAARRASVAQGSALLSLWSRALAAPGQSSVLIDALRADSRSGALDAHFPVCWAVICAACGLSLGA